MPCSNATAAIDAPGWRQASTTAAFSSAPCVRRILFASIVSTWLSWWTLSSRAIPLRSRWVRRALTVQLHVLQQVQDEQGTLDATEFTQGDSEAICRGHPSAANDFAPQWREQSAPTDMYKLLNQFFLPRGKTAAIGDCTGLDVAWLNDNGIPIVGYDASAGLLEQAAECFPHFEFRKGGTSSLDEVEDGVFDNFLCEPGNHASS